MVQLRVLGVFAVLLIVGLFISKAAETPAHGPKSEAGKAAKEKADSKEKDKADSKEKDKKDKADSKEKDKKDKADSKEKDKKDKADSKEKDKKEKDEAKEKDKKVKEEAKEKDKKVKEEAKEKDKKVKEEAKEKDKKVKEEAKEKDKKVKEEAKEKDREVKEKDKKAKEKETQAESDAQLRYGLLVLQAVKAILERADHDYGGHRVDAVRDVGKAHDQLDRALSMAPPQQKAPGKTAPEAQVVSNLQLATAIPILKKTITTLDKANHDYGGHRGDAVRDLTQAVRQLEDALKFEKKKG